MPHDQSSQRKGQISSSRISRNINIGRSDVHKFMNMMNQKFIDKKTVMRSLRERMIRRHPVINRKDRNIKLICPFSCVYLHRSAGKSNKSTPVHVQDHCVYKFGLFLF